MKKIEDYLNFYIGSDVMHSDGSTSKLIGDWIHNETDDAVEFDKEGDSNLWFDNEIIIKKRLIITITYDIDDKTE